MSNIDTGGPAFPSRRRVHIDRYATQEWEPVGGMTLRDYLAAHRNYDSEHSAAYAEAVMGREAPSYKNDPKAHAIFWAEFRATMRYIEADAMLRARGHGQA